MENSDIYQLMTEVTDDLSVKASWIDRYVESPISFWCDLFAPRELQDTLDLFQQHLFETGREHQIEVTEEEYPGAIQKIFETEEDGFAKTLELMAGGEESIKNMPLLCRPEGLEGRPDILIRSDESPSVFGEYSYRIVEIKSAKGIRESHKLQAAFYNRLLGLVQEYEPTEFYIVNGEGEVLTLQASEYIDSLDETLAEIRQIIGGAPVEPCYGAGKWPWESYINSLAIEIDDVSLIPDVGPAKRKNLVALGISKVSEVATSEVETLVQARGIGKVTGNKMLTAAQAIVQSSTVRRTPTSELPKGRTEVFFDFEGTDPRLNAEGLPVVNYLIGTIHRSLDSTPEFKAFFAPSFEDEGQNLRDFLEWASSLDDPVFYHWHYYEKTHLLKMAEFHEIEAGLLAVVVERMVNLHPWATKAFAFPCFGEGLKEIAGSLDFSWRQEDVTGLTTVALYLTYVGTGSSDEESKEKILIYNEDDCLATMHIYDWILSQPD
ncbi:MAG: hypothetical protein BZY87_09815 [SAR202 cluster bacterium Io17-Chloro-G6]|nr:MAG: hypothetical protein BZY87_09815 [SAR202 cluster bacterium Io17-Chloro-G6]